MEKYLTPEVNTMFKAFEECGFELYMVGGCVRDALLNIEPHDIDFATNAMPEQMKDVCAHMFYEMGIDAVTYPSGEKFGTLTFALHMNKNTIKSFEVTTYRADGRYEDGRHPKEVHYAQTIEEDLSRRDFTMNAIAWSPSKGYVDPYHGRDDIRRKMIRTVGNPNERFKEDLLRILRLARFSFRYFFGIDVKTYSGAIDNVSNITSVSFERIGKELQQIFSYNLAGNCVERAKDILNAVLLHIDTTSYIETARRNLIYKYHSPLLRWHSMYENLTPDNIKKALNKLALDSKIVSSVVNIAQATQFLNNSQHEYEHLALGLLTDTEQVYAFLEYFRPVKQTFDRLLTAVLSYYPVKISDLAIDGNVVISVLNIEEGKLVGKYLNECLKYVCRHPEKNTYADLVEYIEYMYYEE